MTPEATPEAIRHYWPLATDEVAEAQARALLRAKAYMSLRRIAATDQEGGFIYQRATGSILGQGRNDGTK